MNNELDEILAYLEYIRSQNRLVSVISAFKGVSYSIIVNIVAVKPKENVVTISTHHRQNMSLLPNTKVTIHSDLFPFPVIAIVGSVETQQKSAVVHNFQYERSVDEHRTHVRVQPLNENLITINCENSVVYNAKIHDISINGISAIFEEVPDNPEKVLIPGTSTRLSFTVEYADTPTSRTFNFPAKIVYANPLDNGKFRLGMQIFPTISDQSALRLYIFDQQTKLFQEVMQSSTQR